MKTGKLPAELLERLLASLPHRDPRVLLGPGTGRDAAVIQFGDRVLVAKADPVTFAEDLAGWYAVNVNANDVACLGARPAWFMATLFLPAGASVSQMESLFAQVRDACTALGVELVGGHSEVTPAVSRPVVAGAMLGETMPNRLVRSDGARPGDCLLLTKGIAIEGTALLARDAPERLLAAGVRRETVERARALLFRPGISVVPEALAAAESDGVHAMHDPTEGGLATALHELAAACGCGLEVRAEDVEVLPETVEVCAALGLDPWGLLASGALLLAVAPETCAALTERLAAVAGACRCIGRVAAPSAGVIMDERGTATPLRRFGRDELARFFDEQEQQARPRLI